MLLLRDVSHVKNFIYFINLVQEGFDINIPSKRRNVDLHPILVRIWVSSSHIRVRKRESPFPVRIKISHSPRAYQ